MYHRKVLGELGVGYATILEVTDTRDHRKVWVNWAVTIDIYDFFFEPAFTGCTTEFRWTILTVGPTYFILEQSNLTIV